jgi:hypothetical protein
VADDASCLWNLSNSQLLSHFQQHYPQLQPWQLWTLQLPIVSALISALQRKHVAPVLVVSTHQLTP